MKRRSQPPSANTEPQRVLVRNQLAKKKDNRRAADLFARILRSVESATERRDRKRQEVDANDGTGPSSDR
jgi:hypothetical protein